MHDHTRPSPEGKHSAPDPSPRGELVARADWPHMFPGQLRQLADLLERWIEREPDSPESMFGCPAMVGLMRELATEARRRATDRDLQIKGTSAQIKLRADAAAQARGEFLAWLNAAGGQLCASYRVIGERLGLSAELASQALNPLLDRSQYDEWHRSLSDADRDAGGLWPDPGKPVLVVRGCPDTIGPNRFVLKGETW